MATISITIGPVTATRTIDDAKAETITTLIFEKVIVPGMAPGDTVPTTAKAKLQAVVDWLVLGMRDKARNARASELQQEQAAQVEAELGAIDV